MKLRSRDLDYFAILDRAKRAGVTCEAVAEKRACPCSSADVFIPVSHENAGGRSVYTFCLVGYPILGRDSYDRLEFLPAAVHTPRVPQIAVKCCEALPRGKTLSFSWAATQP